MPPKKQVAAPAAQPSEKVQTPKRPFQKRCTTPSKAEINEQQDMKPARTRRSNTAVSSDAATEEETITPLKPSSQHSMSESEMPSQQSLSEIEQASGGKKRKGQEQAGKDKSKRQRKAETKESSATSEKPSSPSIQSSPGPAKRSTRKVKVDNSTPSIKSSPGPAKRSTKKAKAENSTPSIKSSPGPTKGSKRKSKTENSTSNAVACLDDTFRKIAEEVRQGKEKQEEERKAREEEEKKLKQEQEAMNKLFAKFATNKEDDVSETKKEKTGEWFGVYEKELGANWMNVYSPAKDHLLKKLESLGVDVKSIKKKSFKTYQDEFDRIFIKNKLGFKELNESERQKIDKAANLYFSQYRRKSKSTP